MLTDYFANATRTNKVVLFLVLAAACAACSVSRAEEPVRIGSSYLAEQIRIHQFACRSAKSEFTLRVDWDPKEGSRQMGIESAKFDGQEIIIAPALHDVFEFLFDTRAIFADCMDQSNSIGIAIDAATNIKEMPGAILYFDLTPTGAIFRELDCEIESGEQSLPTELVNYCQMERQQ